MPVNGPCALQDRIRVGVTRCIKTSAKQLYKNEMMEEAVSSGVYFSRPFPRIVGMLFLLQELPAPKSLKLRARHLPKLALYTARGLRARDSPESRRLDPPLKVGQAVCFFPLIIPASFHTSRLQLNTFQTSLICP